MKEDQKEPRAQEMSTGTKITNAISLMQKKHYGCLSKVFCCKCFYCCQDFDFSLLTSKKRKGVFEEMVRKYLSSTHKSDGNVMIMDPFFILVALMLGEESEIYNELMQEVSNSGKNDRTIFSKEDLEFYIPELCTYLVFHEEMNNAELTTLLERACKIDLHFSIRYYFFMKSLECINTDLVESRLPIVEKYNALFRNKINITHKVKPITEILSIRKRRKSLSVERKGSKQSLECIRSSAKSNSASKPTIESEKEIDRQEHDLHKSLRNSQGSKESQDHSHVLRKSSSSSTEGDVAEEELQHMNEEHMKICKHYNKETQYISTSTLNDKVSFLYPQEIYKPFIFEGKEDYPVGMFESTVGFYFDLVVLSELLIKVENRKETFEEYLKEINFRLPCKVYVPFTKSEYQDANIVNAVVSECKVFKTKERAPFKMTFEVFYSPSENEQSKREKKIRSTTHKQSHVKMRRSALFEQDIMLQIDGEGKEEFHTQELLPSNDNSMENELIEEKNERGSAEKKSKDESLVIDSGTDIEGSGKEGEFKRFKKGVWDKVFELKRRAKELIKENPDKSESKSNESDRKSQKIQDESNFSESHDNKNKDCKSMIDERLETGMEESENEQEFESLFGESALDRNIRIGSRSPYSQLPEYNIISFMVKSNDDLRQECFAMQLLQEFDRIFKMEKLKIKLFPYEVLPLSHDSGVIEFIEDAMTIDELIKKQGSLKFLRKNQAKRTNFLRSLVGYSLVSYFLQVKDRHNQNIMIKRDGTLIHIDYGFFLSSAPGKGVELEGSVPFKLTSEYIEALGGTQSRDFSDFRLEFYKGFNALRKHQHRVIILAKLMYSSYGSTMRCFEKGDEAIEKFVARFNPKNVHTDGELSLFCQKLVNSSIQNWRAKWYDRWQYFAQGIVY